MSKIQTIERTAEDFAELVAAGPQANNRVGLFLPEFQQLSLGREEGKYQLRILPNTWNLKDGNKSKAYAFFLSVKAVYLRGVGYVLEPGSVDESRKDNPLTRLHAELMAAKKVAKAKDVLPKDRVLYAVIDRKAQNLGVQVVNAPVSFHTQLTQVMRSTEKFIIDDPVKGSDITYRVVKEERPEGGFIPNYLDMTILSSAPLSREEAQCDAWETDILETSLKARLNIPTDEQLEAHIEEWRLGAKPKAEVNDADADEGEKKPAAKPEEAAKSATGSDALEL